MLFMLPIRIVRLCVWVPPDLLSRARLSRREKKRSQASQSHEFECWNGNAVPGSADAMAMYALKIILYLLFTI